MMQTLLESRAARTRRTGGTLASVAAHTGLIAAAVALTARAAPAPLAPPRPEPVTFVRPTPP
ncbi:MAG: hypothetical protein KGN74_13780, partial [Gemmatimonadota bacterium]|nr:hypothetical protein [Gemmatimonadota bacterium]